MKKHKSTPHPHISQVKIIQDKNNFPISWLNKQAFCEYGIYLENVKGIKTKPTKAMMEGTKEHSILETQFKKDAEPATFEEIGQACVFLASEGARYINGQSILSDGGMNRAVR